MEANQLHPSAPKTVQASSEGFGTAPVFFTAISTILGAMLFLRFGYAVGSVGFWGMMLIILLGHLVTVPTAFAISELATNTRVEGGGEYFIISRSFGLKIGSTVGIALYLSQAISIAFYVITFTEAFSPLFDFVSRRFGWSLPRQVISLPVLVALGILLVRYGAGIGLKMLYVVTAILFVALMLFFAGNPLVSSDAAAQAGEGNFGAFRLRNVFVWLAICFPAFTGMTAGVGLSGELRNPGKSIPRGTLLGTAAGMFIYIFIVWKLAISASRADLSSDQLIMARIAYFGALVIPVGLGASTLSSAIGSMLVAPRTLQALAIDKSFPSSSINSKLSKGRGRTHEPVYATIVTFILAFVFVSMGSIDSVAQVISMLYLITYGTLCFISCCYHFGSPPSYRPTFKSHWLLSLIGAVSTVTIMILIAPLYAICSFGALVLVYLSISYYKKDEKGLFEIFEGVIFQFNRRMRVLIQKRRTAESASEWRPSVICISRNSFERDKVLELIKWLSHRHGFATYFHYIEGEYSEATHKDSKRILRRLIELPSGAGAMYLHTMVSPSYTSAIAQAIQTPSISGMEHNMALFEYDKSRPEEIALIASELHLAKAGELDICIFADAKTIIRYYNDIHVWLTDADEKNTNLMILLSYIILANDDWKRSTIKVFKISARNIQEEKANLQQRIMAGRLPITLANIEVITMQEDQSLWDVTFKYSSQSGLCIIGFTDDLPRSDIHKYFSRFNGIGDILFVNASKEIDI
ncbi:MAG: amino acid permease [Tannerellaceae bacterium]|jgi:amino acid transporter|nr:amino acid permease [Tannerellaceae bacterium]